MGDTEVELTTGGGRILRKRILDLAHLTTKDEELFFLENEYYPEQ